MKNYWLDKSSPSTWHKSCYWERQKDGQICWVTYLCFSIENSHEEKKVNKFICDQMQLKDGYKRLVISVQMSSFIVHVHAIDRPQFDLFDIFYPKI